ncbi:MAG: tryptophan halogenase [Dehalococcoidia bacterium]|nr:tryptophan halogenase [Dehalococcoidia bacterium]
MTLPNSNEQFDIIVIGGGPAGSTTATMLAKYGYSVLLLERSEFPRDHVGESLLPASIPVLEELGVIDEIRQAGFLPKWGATMIWGVDKDPWSWHFRETNEQYPYSYQVWRPEFDKILLDNSRNHGVDVREGHRVLNVLFDGSKAVGVQYTDSYGYSNVASAEYIVDASGQQNLLGSQLKTKREDPFFRNLAVYGYYTGVPKLPEPDQNNIFIESYENGWTWNIPLHNGFNSVGVVVDCDANQSSIQEYGAQKFYTEELSKTSYMSKLLQTAVLESMPSVVKDWSYSCSPMVGDGYILVGDAACFIDPLFSSGVHLALMSGVLSSTYINTSMKDKTLGLACREVYESLYMKEYGHFRELARLFYSSNRSVESYFWEARRVLDNDSSLSPRSAFIQAVAGQSARGYERVVLQHGDLPKSFVGSINRIESEVRRRAEQFPLDEDSIVLEGATLIPKLAKGVVLERKPVLGEGIFDWGYVLTTLNRNNGIECSELVAILLSKVDGESTLDDLLALFRERASEDDWPTLRKALLNSVRLLYMDGVIERFDPKD